MKKNKITVLAIAAVTSIALGAAGTFAWFFTSRQSNAVAIDTATIAINEVKVNKTTFDNLLPGEVALINTASSANPATIQNTGSRRAIVEISVRDGDLAGTAGSQVDGSFVGDYTGTNKYTHKRLLEVIKFEFATLNTNATSNPNKWKKLTNTTTGEVKYYTFLNVNEAAQALGEIKVTLDGELGGGKAATPGATPSPSRQFEQDSKFTVQFSIRAVQATRAAVVDYFGINDTDLPAGFYEN